MESSGSLFVGNYILQLILHLSSQMAQHMRDLVIALIIRMKSSQIVGLKCSLLLIFARLIHMSVPQVEQFIDLLLSIPAEGHQNAFAYVMFEWSRLQGEVQGAYQIKVTTTALALLLLTRHAELGNANVQGDLIQSGTGITTRSRAKKTSEQWTMVPLPAKILALLADALLEIQEQVDANNEDSDWEEVQNGDSAENDDFLYSADPKSHNRPTYDYLEAMSKAFNEDLEDEIDDEILSYADPLNEINLVSSLVDSLVKLSKADGQYFEHLFQSLTKPRQKAIQLVLRG